MHSREILRALQRDGWVKVRQKGSHVQLEHPTKKPGLVTVQHPIKDMPKGTLCSIEQKSGVKLRG